MNLRVQMESRFKKVNKKLPKLKIIIRAIVIIAIVIIMFLLLLQILLFFFL